MYQTTDWKGNPVWKLENGERVNPDLYVDVTDAKPLPGLKRDRVYGMYAENRRLGEPLRAPLADPYRNP